MHLSGDAAAIIAGPLAFPADVDALRRSLGLDRSLHIQYLTYLWSAIRGDLGESLRFKTPVLGLLVDHWGRTLPLVLASLAVAASAAIPLGVLAAINRGRLLDAAVLWVALVGQATPVFLLAIILVWIFSVQLGVLPVLTQEVSAKYFILPVASLAAFNLAILMRMIRSAMLEVLSEDYVRTARAKGLSLSRVLVKHAFRNASIGLVALIGLQIGYLLSGVLVVESIFAWPGLGKLMYDAILSRDYTLIMGGSLFIAVIISLLNILVDISYSLLDPRIRYG